jgi:protoporphyrinogen oxidase
LIFNRIYYPDHIYDGKNPPDREGICLELNDLTSLQNMSDDRIIARAVSDIEKLGLFKKSALRQQRLFRLKECMPIYGLDYEMKLQETFKAVHGYQNLYSIGRKGGYFFCQTPAAVSQGLKVARHLVESRSYQSPQS